MDSESAAAGVTVDRLLEYLIRTGWRKELSDHEDEVVLGVPERSARKEYRGVPIVVALPVSTGSTTPSAVIAEAVAAISWSEQRPVTEVADDIMSGGSDVLAARILPNTPSGQAPLGLLIEASQGLRQLLLGATWSMSADDRLVPLPRQAGAAESWVSSARVSTEPGSFILNAWLPVQDATTADGVGSPGLFDVVERPYGRAVVERLASDVNKAVRAATRVHEGAATLATLTGRGGARVNTGVLSGLAALGGTEHLAYDLRIGYSQTVRSERDATAVRVAPDIQSVLEDAASKLRAAQPREGVTLRGLVIDLNRVGRFGPGRVVVLGYLSDEAADGVRRVSAELGEVDYNTALRAHESGLEVQARGVVSRRGNRFTLRQVTGFELLPSLFDGV